MITKETFLEVINNYKEFDAFADALYDLNIDIIETSAFSAIGKLFDLFMSSHFKDAGVDIINGWMFEDVDSVKINGENVDITTAEQLWECLKNNGFIQ